MRIKAYFHVRFQMDFLRYDYISEKAAQNWVDLFQSWATVT